MKLTPEQLAELISKVIANILAKNGGSSDISTEDIMTELNALLSESTEAGETEGEKAATPQDTGDVEGKTASEPEAAREPKGACEPKSARSPVEAGIKAADVANIIAKMLAEAFRDRKTFGKTSEAKVAGAAPVEKKSASATPASAQAPAPQRKYASLFLSTGAARDVGLKANGFKTRIASMSGSERRKTAFGMFGRAVKCINASSGDVERAAYTA